MAPHTGTVLHVLYASESGNGEDLADRVARDTAEKARVQIRIRSLDQIDVEELATIGNAIFIVSTTGLGDVPFDAEELWADLIAADAPRLDDLHFGVLALGDRIYADFCTAGIEFDERLAELGAVRAMGIVTCDFDYEAPATRWLREAVPALAPAVEDEADEAGRHGEDQTSDAEAPLLMPSARGRPFHDATLETAQVLSAADEDREIVHYTLALPSQEQEQWQVGDSFDLLQPNDPELVAAVIRELGIDPSHEVQVIRERDEDTSPVPRTAEDLLTDHLELRLLPRALFETIAERTGDAHVARLLDARDGSMEAWMRGRDLLSVLQEFPEAPLGIRDLVRALRPLQARAYSIASSPLVDRTRVDLTVRTIRYEQGGRVLSGTVSGALSHRASVGSRIPVRLRPAPAFHLPEDPSADVVMIGPGVGIAPFRAFLQQREARDDRGRSWLFCGIRDHDRDDLYAEEFARWERHGILTELDVATSRSTEGAEYVQHRIARRGEELVRWLDAGATLYVCGDAREMAPAVRLAVRSAAAHSLGSMAAADAWMSRLDTERRYLQDVY